MNYVRIFDADLPKVHNKQPAVINLDKCFYWYPKNYSIIFVFYGVTMEWDFRDEATFNNYVEMLYVVANINHK